MNHERYCFALLTTNNNDISLVPHTDHGSVGSELHSIPRGLYIERSMVRIRVIPKEFFNSGLTHVMIHCVLAKG